MSTPICITYDDANQAALAVEDALSALPGYKRRMYARHAAAAYYHVLQGKAYVLQKTASIAIFLGGQAVSIEIICGLPEIQFEVSSVLPITQEVA